MLVTQCEQLSVALKQAEEKQLQKERLADEREQQIKHLIQLLQSGVNFLFYLTCFMKSWHVLSRSITSIFGLIVLYLPVI